MKLLGELLSRPKLILQNSYLDDYPEAAALNAILEIKVETAITNEDANKPYYLYLFYVGLSIFIICAIIYVITLWRPSQQLCTRQSEINLSVTETTLRHDEEKSNNLQNEENFRRYANPLKGSAMSLRSAVEMTLSTIPDNLPGPSGLNRSQCIYPPMTNDTITNDFDFEAAKSINSQTLYKTQNLDVDKNTVQSMESGMKDFDKRINKLNFKKTFSSSTLSNSSSSNVTTTTTTTSPSISNNIISNNHHLTNINNHTNHSDMLTVHI